VLIDASLEDTPKRGEEITNSEALPVSAASGTEKGISIRARTYKRENPTEE